MLRAEYFPPGCIQESNKRYTIYHRGGKYSAPMVDSNELMSSTFQYQSPHIILFNHIITALQSKIRNFAHGKKK